MPTGSDGDEELLLEELEAEPDAEDEAGPRPAAPPTLPRLPAAATASSPDVPDFDEAAGQDTRADAALMEAEAATETDGARRAALWLEVARLEESALGDGEAALRAAREAFAAEPTFAAALGPLRRLLAARGLWDELVAALDAVLARATLAAEDRADLLVERGRVLEDRLARPEEARDSHDAALAAVPDHAPALLALFVNASRAADGDALERALAGLARRARTPARRVALTASLARMLRAAGAAGGAARALRVVRDALHERVPEMPLAPLLAELDALSRGEDQPTVRARALQELGHEAELDAPWVAALLRERARLLAERLDDPRGALDALEGAARLQPGHALVAAELVELAADQDRFDVVERVVARFEAAGRGAGVGVERAQSLALRQVAALGRRGRLAEALAALDASPGLKRAAGQPAVFGLRVALLARARDAQGLVAAFAAEGARAGGAAGARALVFAAAVRQWWADDATGAEELYRRAIAAAPTERAAWDALESLLAAQGRWAELAELLEAGLAEIVGSSDAAERELTLREELVALYRDDLHAPEKAFAHQKQLVAAAPRDVRQRVRLHDLELAGGIEASDVAEATTEEVESLRVLAAGADDAAVAAALKVEAARLLGHGGEDPARRAEASRLLSEAAPDDVTGLGTALLEATHADPAARAVVVASELESAMTEAPAEIVRALRFRLAHHLAAGGRYAEAMAALTPLRAEEDPLARAWSWDLARRSRDAILEVAVLSDEARSRRGVLGAPPDVEVAYGEALERAGDAPGAAQAFTRALAETPSAEAALGLLRVAATTSARPEAMSAALAALQVACGDEPRVAAAAGREEALLRVASGAVDAADLEASAPPGASAVEVAEAAIVRWAAGVTRGEPAVVADALLDLGATMTAAGGEGAAAAVPLLARASARARLAGRDVSEALHKRIWRTSHAPRLATAVADLPVTPGEGWPSDRPDPRRARATKVGGPFGLTLDLEAALDAERRGALSAALGGYGRVIGVAPDHLEAWEGIRRVARAGDDPLGEARALCRLGTITRTPALAGALYSQAARLFEQVGRWEEALALWGHALDATPDDADAFDRLHALLLGDLAAAGRLEALERVLTHRLTAATIFDDERVALLFERALHRSERLGDAGAAAQDFKRILKIYGRHVESLWRLGRLALESRDAASAASALARFVEVAPDDARADDARMELASVYEATHDRARAIETLRRAAALRPGDRAPLERLIELHTRLGEWRSAVEILRDWEGREPEARDRAVLQLRIGALLRDVGRDATGASVAFRRAAELDPLGEGGRALVALHDAQSDGRGAVQTIERELAELRGALARDPLDEARLARLDDFLSELARRAPSPVVAASHAAVVEVRGLLRDGGADASGPVRARGVPRPLALRSGEGSAFWSRLAYPGALGFRAEIWPHLVESASALFPSAAKTAPGRARRLDAGEEPRLAWAFATAAACGLGGLHVYLSPALPDAEPALIIEEPEAALVIGPAALEPSASTRFLVGRALGMLRARAAVLDRVEPAALGPLFACAAVTAGASPPPELGRPDANTDRIVGKAMSRRDRKALVLQASRFGFESIDPTRWGLAVRRTADRLGLLLAGDLGVAARTAARTDPERWKSAVRQTANRLAHMLDGDGAGPPPAEAPAPSMLDRVRGSERALDLLRFGLGDVYPALRREVERDGEPSP